MSEESSPKQQLMIARQQLDKLSIFIASLADFFYGTSPAIDQEFQQIKKLLQGKPDYSKAAEVSTGLNAKLKKESKFMLQKNADTLSKIQSALRHLTELQAVDSEVKREIKQFMLTLVPKEGNKTSPVAQFEEALGLFRKALSNNVVMHKQQDEAEQKKLQQQITQELRELIAPFYIKNNSDVTLLEINQKLNEGLGNKELLECCLIMIRFVMKDVLTEASSATRLINDIHKSLVQIKQGIHSTISKSEDRLSKRQLETSAMKAQITAMESALSGTSDVKDLKKQASQYLTQLQNSLNMSEQQDRAEQEKVISLLQSMQTRLGELETKADSYKQKLLQQRVNAMTDTLTKLPNRMAYEEKVNKEFKRVKLEKATAFMAIFDIDHFKQINDKYGHSVGDKTLQIIANHIRKLIDKDDFLARWGGEEFVAILFDNDINACFQKLEALRSKIATLPFMFKGTRVSITISIGLTSFDQHTHISDAFEAADTLLYAAKSKGRNQTCIDKGYLK